MKEIYVHTLRYHYYGRGNRSSRTMFPQSYGPFRDEDAAWEWVRQSGITRAVRLMDVPAVDHIKIGPSISPLNLEREYGGFLTVAKQQNSAL